MQFAIVDGQRREAAPNLRGECIVCGAAATSKCGSKVIWHWAHSGRRHCDPWWENETSWHRQWKSYFPEEWREIVHVDTNGERHVADVKTPRDMVIEFQNSPMPPKELEARENFYGRMLWIVNGCDFISRFDVGPPLPDPKSEFARDLVFSERGTTFWRKSENPDYSGSNSLVLGQHQPERSCRTRRR